jgi:hypothetical protein
LQELRIEDVGHVFSWRIEDDVIITIGTNLNQRFGSLDEMTLALSRSTLLSPIDDGLVGNTVLVVEDLEDLRERLDDPRFGVAVNLAITENVVA